MKVRLQGGLLYVTAELTFKDQTLSLSDVILDTGSAATVFSSDEVSQLGLVPEPRDPVRRIRGVGGSEFVYSKQLDSLALGDLQRRGFPVQIGAMDYGFPIQGIIGLDFLLDTGALIDLERLEVYRATPE